MKILQNTRRVQWEYQIAELIVKGFPEMDGKLRNDISEWLVENGIYKEVRKTTPGGFGWRLLFPVYFLFGVMMLISMPFKWLFTGTSDYSRKSWLGNFCDAWTAKYWK